MIETFLFDMGNVLVTFCHDRMCRQMGELCGRSGPDVRRRVIDSGLQWKFERGEVTPDDFHQQFEEAVEARVDAGDLFLAASDIFSPNLSLLPILHQLKQRGHRLVLLSNTSVWHFQFVGDRFEMLKPFDDYVLSCRAGAMKPDRPIYDAALQLIHCDPRNSFYTDDIPAYVEAGRSHGIDSEIFTGTDKLLEQLALRGIDLR